ncbi:MAG TPA: prolipoprotein diacylglyceryl transferase [Saprospiraceae bacterium]|nr:prolipoprotein diacylglyceryl transferase [Saprospiraceae bacterium]
MYPDLSYLFNDLFGTQVDNWTSIFKSFGLMLALAFVACSWLLRSELMRLEKDGLIKPLSVKNNAKAYTMSDLLLNAAVTMIAGAKIPYIFMHFAEFKADPSSIIFSKLGLWPVGILIGALMGAYLYFTKYKKQEAAAEEVIIVHPHEKTMDIIFLAAISGVLGSRLFSIFENMETFLRDPIGTLFAGSGLTIYGGLILAFIAVYWYVKKVGIRPIYMMDIAAMGILLGYAIGRIGCQISGDGDWGIVAAPQPSWWFLPDWIWSYNFPHNVAGEGVPMAGCDVAKFSSLQGSVEDRCEAACGMRYCLELPEKVYPTSFYETILSLTGFGLLWLVRKRIKITGQLFFLYMIYNGVERFFIETIRVNEKYNYFGADWSQAQYISVGFVLVGILGALYLSRKKPGWEQQI